jgi:hypothetical protein
VLQHIQSLGNEADRHNIAAYGVLHYPAFWRTNGE